MSHCCQTLNRTLGAMTQWHSLSLYHCILCSPGTSETTCSLSCRPAGCRRWRTWRHSETPPSKTSRPQRSSRRSTCWHSPTPTTAANSSGRQPMRLVVIPQHNTLYHAIPHYTTAHYITPHKSGRQQTRQYYYITHHITSHNITQPRASADVVGDLPHQAIQYITWLTTNHIR